MIRRLWYATLGALAAYAYQRIRNEARGPWTVRIVTEIPAFLLPADMIGIGTEVQVLVRGDIEPDADGPPGLDPDIWGGMNGGGS